MTEKVDKITKEETKQKIATTEENTTLDLHTLSLDLLIARVEKLSLNDNPYSVSKTIENIKSVFYQKIKEELETKNPNAPVTDDNKKESEKKNKELHPLEDKFKQAFGNYRKIKSNFRKKRDAEEQNNLKIKIQIIKDIDELTKKEESKRKTFEKFRELLNKWKNTGYVPANQKNNLWQSYHHHIELFYDFIKLNDDLRDLDFKRNLEEKSTICDKAEALVNEDSLNKMHNTLQELHEHWKSVGPVRRELREEIWERFQNISKVLNKKRNDYFTSKKEEDKRKLIIKNEICSRINELTIDSPNSHSQWEALVIKCNKLEIKWKEIGRLNKIENKIAWNNFKESLNNFYQKKHAFYKEVKNKNNKILEIKTEICKEAEALQEDTNWQQTTKKLITLQNKWKNTGYSSKERSNRLWVRFKRACDTFFNSKKTHFKELDKQKEKNLKQKTDLILELKQFTCTKKKEKDIKFLKELSTKWKNIGHVPKEKININNDFLSLINLKYEEIGLNKSELEKEKYKNKITTLKGNKKAIENEKNKLRNKIELIKKEIAQYENNISFFRKNKETNALLTQVLKEIKKSNNKIEETEQKIKLLNQQ